MAREEIGIQPRSKVILRHAQQCFDTISSEVFLFSPFFACQGKPLLSEYETREAVLELGKNKVWRLVIQANNKLYLLKSTNQNICVNQGIVARFKGNFIISYICTIRTKTVNN